jgi:hypothetical protein
MHMSLHNYLQKRHLNRSIHQCSYKYNSKGVYGEGMHEGKKRRNTKKDIIKMSHR